MAPTAVSEPTRRERTEIRCSCAQHWIRLNCMYIQTLFFWFLIEWKRVKKHCIFLCHLLPVGEITLQFLSWKCNPEVRKKSPKHEGKSQLSPEQVPIGRFPSNHVIVTAVQFWITHHIFGDNGHQYR